MEMNGAGVVGGTTCGCSYVWVATGAAHLKRFACLQFVCCMVWQVPAVSSVCMCTSCKLPESCNNLDGYCCACRTCGALLLVSCRCACLSWVWGAAARADVVEPGRTSSAQITAGILTHQTCNTFFKHELSSYRAVAGVGPCAYMTAAVASSTGTLNSGPATDVLLTTRTPKSLHINLLQMLVPSHIGSAQPCTNGKEGSDCQPTQPCMQWQSRTYISTGTLQPLCNAYSAYGQ
jgi:hypothetical protein